VIRIVGWLVLCVLLPACGVDDSPQDSSGSHWLSCAADSECAPYDPRAVCVDRYCEGEDGARLVRDPAKDSDRSVGGSGGAPGPDASNAGGHGEGAAGAASDGGAAASDGGAAGSAPGVDCPRLPDPLDTANVFDGDYVITGPESVDAAAGFSEISGTLTFSPRAVADVTEVVLPGLERVGGISVALSMLLRLDLPRLQTLSGDLILNNNAALQQARFASLASIGGTLTVRDNPDLAELSLPTLTSVGTVVEIGPAALPNCEVQALFDTLAEARTYDAGRDDCTCALVCERWTATCP
jgi:hypothetical protein